MSDLDPLALVQQLEARERRARRRAMLYTIIPIVLTAALVLYAAHEFRESAEERTTKQQELNKKQQALTGAQQALTGTQQDLARSQQDLARSRQKLTGTRRDLIETRREFAGTRQELIGTQQALTQSRLALSAVDTQSRESAAFTKAVAATVPPPREDLLQKLLAGTVRTADEGAAQLPGRVEGHPSEERQAPADLGAVVPPVTRPAAPKTPE
ncbi:MAG: hypothetical protein ABSD27_06590 [Bryobacteraceae bacterium]|jgi:septal ring factor EnvC (AmiA/AmiB activator)